MTEVALGARVVCLRSLQAPALDPAPFARAGLELADLALPSGDEQVLAHLVQALASGCSSLILDLEEREIADRLRKTAGPELPAVHASQATLIHNTALALSALRARRVELPDATFAIGGNEGTLVAEALQALGADAARFQPLALPLPEVDVILASTERLAELPAPSEEPPAEDEVPPPTRLELPTRDPGRVLPALLRAATDTGRVLDFQGCALVAGALVELSRGDGTLPDLDDLRLLPTLAAVAAEAGRPPGLEEGAAAPEFDPVPYQEAVEGVQSPLRRALASAVERARKSARRLIILDAEDPQALLAARLLAQQQLAEPILLGDLFKLESRAQELGLSLRGLQVHNPKRDKLREPYAQALHEVLGEQLALDLDEARRWVEDPQVFAALTLARGEADGVLGLSRQDRGLEPLARALAILPQRAKGSGTRKAGLHLVARRDRTFVVTDTLGPHDPTSEEVADAALDAAAFVEEILGETPRVAILAGATHGARGNVSLERLARARDLARVRRPGLIVDGPLRAEVALEADVQRERYPACALKGEPANVLVVPGQSAARIALDLLTCVAEAESAGPFVWSLRHPLGLAPLGASAETIVHTALVTTALAIQADLQHKDDPKTPLREALERHVAAAKEAEDDEDAEDQGADAAEQEGKEAAKAPTPKPKPAPTPKPTVPAPSEPKVEASPPEAPTEPPTRADATSPRRETRSTPRGDVPLIRDPDSPHERALREEKASRDQAKSRARQAKRERAEGAEPKKATRPPTARPKSEQAGGGEPKKATRPPTAKSAPKPGADKPRPKERPKLTKEEAEARARRKAKLRARDEAAKRPPPPAAR